MRILKATNVSLVLVTRPDGSPLARQRQVVRFRLSDHTEQIMTMLFIFLAALALVVVDQLRVNVAETIVRTIEFWSLVIFIYWTGSRALCSEIVARI